MMTYVSAFIFYTLAMMGVLFVGFVIYKKTFLITKTNNNGNIKIIDSLMIAPKKMLFVVKIKNECFLIASGDTHTTFLAKLENNKESEADLSNANLSALLQNLAQANLVQNQEQSNISQFQKQQPQSIYQNAMNFNEPSEISCNNQKIEQIQRQFKTLYSKDSKTPALFSKAQNKKQVIRRLIKELNETMSSAKGEING